MPFLWSTIRYLALSLLVASASAYFVVTSPTTQTQWQNGKVNAVTWEKGVLDDINSFDLEMTRLSEDGLTYIASTISGYKKAKTSLNIYLEDVPAGDDYYLLFLNTSHGVMYAVSSRFTILEADATPDSSKSATATAEAGAATVTVSGGPNPTKMFATTFPAEANGSVLAYTWNSAGVGMLCALLACLSGALFTLW